MKTFKSFFIKSIYSLCVFSFSIFMATAQNTVSHDFNNGSLGPFEECTTAGSNYSRALNNRLETFWQESEYVGRETRVWRGAEACADQWFTYKEGWYGMNVETVSYTHLTLPTIYSV